MFAVVTLRRFLCLLALIGVVFGPVRIVTAASAMAVSGMQMAAMLGMDGSQAMPCCPDQGPTQKHDCAKACSLALKCSSTTPAKDERAGGWHIDLSYRELPHFILQENRLPSALVEPPARPPKV